MADGRSGRRLVLLEGTWGKAAGTDGLRAFARALAGRIRRAAPDHHGHYSDCVVQALPHARGLSPAEAVALVQASPWGPARVERLRDVEWAVLEGRGLVDQILGTHARWAVIAGS